MKVTHILRLELRKLAMYSSDEGDCNAIEFLKFINGRASFQIPLEDRFLDVQVKFTFVISGSCLYVLSYFCK